MSSSLTSESGRERFKAIAFIVGCCVIFTWFGIDYATGYENSKNIASCERTNQARVATIALYDALLAVNHDRVQAGGTPAQVAANESAVKAYGHARRLFVQAQASVATHPGSVIVDCAVAFPDPWPGPF